MPRLIKNLSLALFLLALGLPGALADSPQYAVTGTFGASTATTFLSAPNTTFRLIFTEPSLVPVTRASRIYD